MSFLRRLDDRVLPGLTRGAERLVRNRVRLGWVGAGMGFVVLAATFARMQPGGDDPTPSARSVTRVGPVQGTLINGYVATARQELAELAGAGTRPVFALVSLAGYGTPAQAGSLSAGYAVARVFFRVPLQGVQTALRSADVTELRGGVEAGMRSAAAQAEREAKELDAQAARLTGSSATERQLRAFYVDSARLSRLQGSQYRSLCACVYALVLKATPQELTTLAARTGVRVVDPVPEIPSLGNAVFLPLLPEQSVTVQPPVDVLLAPSSTPSAEASPSPS